MKKSELVPKIALLADDRCLVKRSKKWYRAAGTGTYLADTAERRPPAAAAISSFPVLQMKRIFCELIFVIVFWCFIVITFVFSQLFVFVFATYESMFVFILNVLFWCVQVFYWCLSILVVSFSSWWRITKIINSQRATISMTLSR